MPKTGDSSEAPRVYNEDGKTVPGGNFIAPATAFAMKSPPRSVTTVEVRHENGCAFGHGEECDCQPEVTLLDVTLKQ